jgi:radical SAM protein with 4Fe4S-binding SPASM domain
MEKMHLLHRAKRKLEEDGFKKLIENSFLRLKEWLLPIILSKLPFLQRIYHPKLSSVNIEITNACNLRCKMCFGRDTRPTGYMSLEMFDKILLQLKRLRVDNISLEHAGESLLHSQFKTMLKNAIKMRNELGTETKVGWVDNGMLFTKEIAELVVSLEVDYVCFSLDGIGEVNDKIRLGSDYSTIEKNIKDLIEIRGKKTKPQIVINIVDYGKTEQEIRSVIESWAPLVDQVVVLPCITTSLHQLAGEKYYADAGKRELMKKVPYCNSPFTFMAISWDGKVTACCNEFAFLMKLGNINNQSIEEIWNGKGYNEFRKMAITNKFTILPCNTCDYWKYEFVLSQEKFSPEISIFYEGRAKIYRKIKQHILKTNAL